VPDAQSLSTLLLTSFVLAVAAIDLRTHRIPNAPVLPAAALGCALQTWMYGWQGLLAAGSGIVLGLAIFLPFYALRAFGAGDVKAMAAAGAFLGVKLTVLAAALTLVAGSFLGLVVAGTSGTAVATLYRVVGVLAAPRSQAKASGHRGLSQPQRFPYGAAIAFGVLAALLWSGGIKTYN
jgi:prepilin peptidase CpaA